jgi:K+-transporting ATPase ATPase C chain
MRRDLVTALIGVAALTLILGVLYPLVVTGISQVVFPGKADGSQIERGGRVVGSRLIGQDFSGRPQYFQSRPSTATKYAADATSFTNLGPNSKDARDTFRKNLALYLHRERRFDPALAAGAVPVDAVTSSASGIDPHISQANAAIQARRVAAVRRVPLATVQRLIDENTAGRFLGLIGEPGVNVLELNLALDRSTG